MSKAVALDIDGVLLRGNKLLKTAIPAIRLLNEHRIPHIFITNGGGCTEARKATDLSSKLGYPISTNQILLSHTPMKSLASQYSDTRVLVLGHAGCMEVARSYGFKFPTSAREILEEFPSIYPGHEPVQPHSHNIGNSSFGCALIIHDPLDWALEMQVLTDVLIDGGHLQAACNQSSHNMTQAIPLYCCNADLVYTTEFPRPRYTQGAFAEAFRTIFEQYTGNPLSINFCGKPFEVQYQYAESLLTQEAVRHGVSEPTVYYGVGDNPKADIRGANNAGHRWTSVLVRTGVFQGHENDEVDAADVVVDDVLAAVEFICSS